MFEFLGGKLIKSQSILVAEDRRALGSLGTKGPVALLSRREKDAMFSNRHNSSSFRHLRRKGMLGDSLKRLLLFSQQLHVAASIALILFDLLLLDSPLPDGLNTHSTFVPSFTGAFRQSVKHTLLVVQLPKAEPELRPAETV